MTLTTYATPPDEPDEPWYRYLGDGYTIHMTPSWPEFDTRPSGLYRGDDLVYEINTYFDYQTRIFFSEDRMTFLLFYPPYYAVDEIPELDGRRILGRVHQFYRGNQEQIFWDVDRYYIIREGGVSYALRIITLDERDILFDLQAGNVVSDVEYEGNIQVPMWSYIGIGLFFVAIAFVFMWSSSIRKKQRIYHQA